MQVCKTGCHSQENGQGKIGMDVKTEGEGNKKAGKREQHKDSTICHMLNIYSKYRSSGNFRTGKIFLSHSYYENNKYEN